MIEVVGMALDIAFGKSDDKVVDWRAAVDDEVDPDDELTDTSDDVKGMLGFDPMFED